MTMVNSEHIFEDIMEVQKYYEYINVILSFDYKQSLDWQFVYAIHKNKHKSHNKQQTSTKQLYRN